MPGPTMGRVSVDTLDEVDYYKHGGILQFVLRQLLRESEPAGRAWDSLRHRRLVGSRDPNELKGGGAGGEQV
jgi:hypothetical protein